MTDDYVARREAERILARNTARVAEIEKNLVERIAGRVAGGENPQVVTFEEIQRSLVELDTASVEVRQALAALPQRTRGSGQNG